MATLLSLMQEAEATYVGWYKTGTGGGARTLGLVVGLC